MYLLFFGATFPPCSDKLVIARFLFWRTAGCVSMTHKVRCRSFQSKNIPSEPAEFSTGSTDSALTESTVSGAALVFDRVERVAGGRGTLPDASFAFFLLAMVVGWNGVNFCFPPVVAEFLCGAIFLSTEFISFFKSPLRR